MQTLTAPNLCAHPMAACTVAAALRRIALQRKLAHIVRVGH